MDSKKAIKTRLFVDFSECGNLEGIKTKGTENILVAYGQARMLKITYQCHIYATVSSNAPPSSFPNFYSSTKGQ